MSDSTSPAKEIPWSRQIDDIKNLPADYPRDRLRQFAGSKGAIHLIYLQRKADAGKGKFKYDRHFLGRVIDRVFVPEEEFRRTHKRGGEPRVEPKKKTMPTPAAAKVEVLEQPTAEAKQAPQEFQEKFVGCGPLVWEIAKQIGIIDDLMKAFGPLLTFMLMNAVIYEIDSGSCVVRRYEKWAEERLLPFNTANEKDFALALKSCGADRNAINKFFIERKHRAEELEKIAFDSTNMGYDSEGNPLSQPGKGKEGGIRKQLNLSVLFTERSLGVIGFDLYEGSVHDSKNFIEMYKRLCSDLKKTNKIVKVIIDRGYHTKEILDQALDSGHHVVIAAKKNALWVREAISSAAAGGLTQVQNSLQEFRGIRGVTCVIDPNSEEFKKRKLKSLPKSTEWLHIYQDTVRQAHEEAKFLSRLDAYKEAKENNLDVTQEAEKECARFVTRVRGKRTEYEFKWKNIQAHCRELGIFANITTKECTAEEAMHDYRGRDCIEKHFQLGKTNLDLGSVRAHSANTAYARAFIGTLAMTICGQIRFRLSKENSLMTAAAMRLTKRPALSPEEEGISLDDVINGFRSMRVIKDGNGDVRFAPVTRHMERYAEMLGASACLEEVPEYCRRDLAKEAAGRALIEDLRAQDASAT